MLVAALQNGRQLLEYYIFEVVSSITRFKKLEQYKFASEVEIFYCEYEKKIEDNA